MTAPLVLLFEFTQENLLRRSRTAVGRHWAEGRPATISPWAFLLGCHDLHDSANLTTILHLPTHSADFCTGWITHTHKHSSRSGFLVAESGMQSFGTVGRVALSILNAYVVRVKRVRDAKETAEGAAQRGGQ